MMAVNCTARRINFAPEEDSREMCDDQRRRERDKEVGMEKRGRDREHVRKPLVEWGGGRRILRAQILPFAVWLQFGPILLSSHQIFSQVY